MPETKEVPFTPVDLTWQEVTYDVAHTTAGWRFQPPPPTTNANFFNKYKQVTAANRLVETALFGCFGMPDITFPKVDPFSKTLAIFRAFICRFCIVLVVVVCIAFVLHCSGCRKLAKGAEVVTNIKMAQNN